MCHLGMGKCDSDITEIKYTGVFKNDFSKKTLEDLSKIHCQDSFANPATSSSSKALILAA